MNEENLEQLVCHNRNLVHVATGLRADLQDVRSELFQARLDLGKAHAAMGVVIDAANSITCHNQDDPEEMVVPVEDIEDMRAVLVMYRKRRTIDEKEQQ